MIKNKVHSVQVRLLNLSRETGIAYQQIITRYFQERLLRRLSESRYRENFVLKGGALLYAHNREGARPTLDLDFMGQMISREKENLMQVFKEIYCMENADGVLFVEETITTEDISVDKRYPGVRLGVLAKLGNIRQVVSMDIGFGDVVVPHPMELDYPTLLDDEEISILAYSIETVIAEKLQTMADRYKGNSRMKDFFDVWILSKAESIIPDVLNEAINITFQNRGTILSKIKNLFTEDFRSDERMNLQWNAFRRKLKRELPPFPIVMAEIEEQLILVSYIEDRRASKDSI